MATFARTRLVAVVVVLIIPAVLYPLVGLWTFLWLPFAVLLLGVVLARPSLLDAALAPVTGKGGFQAPEGEPDGEEAAQDKGNRVRGQALGGRSGRAEEPAPVAVPRGETGTRGVRVRRTELPSSADDYAFGFSAIVHWRWAHRVDLSLRNPAGPAVHSVVLRAREVLCEVQPEDRAVAESELEALFAVESPVAGGTIEVWADEVRLELDEEDGERLRRLARLRKDRALWAAEHEAEQIRRSLSAEPGRGPAPALAPDPPLSTGAHEIPDLPDPAVPMPGSGVDEEGYESYWWPAEQEEDGGGAEQDVQVAILRGLIDSVEDEAERAEFVREQVGILERTGFPDVAERIQSVYPER